MGRTAPHFSQKALTYLAETEAASLAAKFPTIPSVPGLRMRSVVACILTIVSIFAAAVTFVCPDRALAQAPLTAPTRARSSPALVIAFVGGFVHTDDARHSEVQIAQELQGAYGNDVQVEIFRNRERARAYKSILNWWNRKERTRPGEEEHNAPLILFGHSWGASAVVSLARELDRDSIPVSLTIQVDSVRKHGQDDSIIPANVAQAINFYQPDGIVHGRSEITAADPSRTRILGNLRFKYEKEPAECRDYPWYDRLFFKGHTAIECDPRVWSQVEKLIRNRLASAQGAMAVQAAN
jgi:hypothetical protein